MKMKLNIKKLREQKNTSFISTDESLKDIEPYFTSEELIEFIETAPIEDVTELLKSYNIKFENNNYKRRDLNMKNIREDLSMMMSDLIDRAEFAELSSEERIEQMAKIDSSIEVLFELINDLQQDYDELEAEEKAYQERKAKLKEKISDARSVFSRKKENPDENRLIQLSYDISAKMNALRAKSRRTEMEEEQLRKLQEQLDDIARILEN